MKSVYRYVGLMISLVFLSFNSVAEVLFDTAAPPTMSGGLAVNDKFWQFHRFEVSSTVTLKNVGGVFSNGLGSIDVFAAVVRLTSSTDRPNSFDLTTPDLVGTTLVSIGPSGLGAVFEGTINLVLTPGWYALGFGTGAFGASSIPSSTSLTMVRHATDLAPGQLAFTHILTIPTSTGQSSIVRFFGTLSDVTCEGFQPPMSNYLVKAKKNRAFPLKMELFDGDGFEQTDAELTAPPVVQVIFAESGGGIPVDVSDDVLSAGQGSDGNQFDFTDDGIWQFNLKSNKYTAEGEYLITAVSGDESEYNINPSCVSSFVID